MHSSVSTTSTDDMKMATEHMTKEESEQAVTGRHQTKSLKASIVSLLPDSFTTSHNVEGHEHPQNQHIWSDHYFASDLNEPTLSESLEQAGRQDMIAGVDHESTITNKLRSMLHSVQDQAIATIHDAENAPKKLIGSIRGDKTNPE